MSSDWYWVHVRKPANDRSMTYAVIASKKWTRTDRILLKRLWNDVPPYKRDEAAIAKQLGRTIEACRFEAHNIRRRGVGRR